MWLRRQNEGASQPLIIADRFVLELRDKTEATQIMRLEQLQMYAQVVVLTGRRDTWENQLTTWWDKAARQFSKIIIWVGNRGQIAPDESPGFMIKMVRALMQIASAGAKPEERVVVTLPKYCNEQAYRGQPAAKKKQKIKRKYGAEFNQILLTEDLTCLQGEVGAEDLDAWLDYDVGALEKEGRYTAEAWNAILDFFINLCVSRVLEVDRGFDGNGPIPVVKEGTVAYTATAKDWPAQGLPYCGLVSGVVAQLFGYADTEQKARGRVEGSFSRTAEDPTGNMPLRQAVLITRCGYASASSRKILEKALESAAKAVTGAEANWHIPMWGRELEDLPWHVTKASIRRAFRLKDVTIVVYRKADYPL